MKTVAVVVTSPMTALFKGVWAPGRGRGQIGAPAITITSNAGFPTCGCVTSGTGTAADPT